jgi:DNA-binding CsgD family transcriptional regulator
MSLALSKTVTAIYDAVMDEERRSAFLQAVADYLEVAGAGYLVIDKQTGQARAANWWGCFSGSPADYGAHYSKIDPFQAARQKVPRGSFVRMTEILQPDMVARSEWYNDFVLKGGVSDTLGGKLHETGSHIVLVGLYRAIDDNHPLPPNPAALAALVEPLCKAARLDIEIQETGFRSAIAEKALDQLAACVIFTDGDGQVLGTNPHAEAVLSRGDGLTLRNGRLCAPRTFETARLARLIAAAAHATEPSAGCMLIARGGGAAPYVVRVAPVAVALAVFDRPVAMVLMTMPAECRTSERDVAVLYGLSPAESRLAVALTRGKRLADLAPEFGVQITTLRTQVAAILEKLEVERQSDIVRLVSSIAV